MTDHKDPVGEARIAEDGTVTVKIDAPIFTPSPELLAVINRAITDRLEPVREEIAGLRKRAAACADKAEGGSDIWRASHCSKASAYRHAADLIEALLA